jgi:hypothetical protein
MSAEYDDYTGGEADAGAEGAGAFAPDDIEQYDEPDGDDLAARVAAVEQAQIDARRYDDAERLAQTYPELTQPEEAQALVRAAREAAEFLGRPELAEEPRFWGLLYEQGVAAGGGGGSRGGQSAADPRIEEIISGGRPGLGSAVLNFEDGESRGSAPRGGRHVLDFGD